VCVCDLTSTNVYCTWGTDERCSCIGVEQTLRAHSPGGVAFLWEMTSWPAFWNYAVISQIRLINGLVFTWRTILPNFTPILF